MCEWGLSREWTGFGQFCLTLNGQWNNEKYLVTYTTFVPFPILLLCPRSSPLIKMWRKPGWNPKRTKEWRTAMHEKWDVPQDMSHALSATVWKRLLRVARNLNLMNRLFFFYFPLNIFGSRKTLDNWNHGYGISAYRGSSVVQMERIYSVSFKEGEMNSVSEVFFFKWHLSKAWQTCYHYHKAMRMRKDKCVIIFYILVHTLAS